MRQRSNDIEKKTWYRSERLINQGEYWYFTTREGNVEGPFLGRLEAVLQLDRYIKVMQSELLNGGQELSLKPLDDDS